MTFITSHFRIYFPGLANLIRESTQPGLWHENLSEVGPGHVIFL